MKIDMGKVDSDLIEKIGHSGYPGQSGTMRVRYTDGVTYDYHHVPYSVFAAIVRAKSKGAQLLKVRDNYKATKV